MELAIDHVQLAMPAGGEALADGFYGAVLGFVSVPKPPALAARGGRWYERGALKVHLGVDPEFRSAHKAHVAFTVSGYEELRAALRAAGARVEDDTEIPGTERCYTWDPFGNRLELIRG